MGSFLPGVRVRLHLLVEGGLTTSKGAPGKERKGRTFLLSGKSDHWGGKGKKNGTSLTLPWRWENALPLKEASPDEGKLCLIKVVPNMRGKDHRTYGI